MKKSRLSLFRSLFVFVLSSLCVSASAADPAGNVIVLKAARFFDGKAKALVNCTLLQQSSDLTNR